GKFQELPEIARERLDRQLADRNLDVGLLRERNVAAPRLLRGCNALDGMDGVEQTLGDDRGSVATIDELARNFERIEHDGVAAQLAPERVQERRQQRDQDDRQQDREERRDVLRKPREDVLLGAVG